MVATNDLAVRLLAHLRADLQQPDLEYAQPPAAISGGYDTRVFAFRVTARGVWAAPLVLRLLGPQHDPRRALREEATQNAVAALGYPAPRVLAASADESLLGGPFLIMERIAGRPMLDERWHGAGSTLAEAQARLHDLDPRPLLEAMATLDARQTVTLEGLLDQLHGRVDRNGLDSLCPAIQWLLARRPRSPGPPVICHGDFHPQNVLMAGGRITGVLDWPNVVVADAAYDVASTRIILSLVPLTLLPIAPPVRLLVHVMRRLMTAQYLRAYRRRRRVDAAAMPYYEAVSCMRQLVRVVEARTNNAATPLDKSDFGERIAAHFTAVTGIAAKIPAAPR